MAESHRAADGAVGTARRLNWKPYQPVIEKYNGGPVVLDRQIISPVALSRAEQLERVYNHGLDR